MGIYEKYQKSENVLLIAPVRYANDEKSRAPTGLSEKNMGNIGISQDQYGRNMGVFGAFFGKIWEKCKVFYRHDVISKKKVAKM